MKMKKKEESFADLALKGLNKFRQNPSSLEFDISRFKLALERFGVKDPKYLAEIDTTIEELKTFSVQPKFVLMEDLCKKAEIEADKFSKNPQTYKRIQKGRELERLSKHDLANDDAVLIAVEQDLPEDMPIKLLLNKEDKDKLGKKFLCGHDYVELGVGSVVDKEDDTYAVVLIGKAGSLGDDVVEGDYDLSELKEAFDLFDIHKTGLIKTEHIITMMTNMGYTELHPELVKIIKEMNEEKGSKISFPTFANFILENITNFEDEDYLRRIFNLYVDDQKNQTISAVSLQQLMEDLKEEGSLAIVKDVLNSENGGEYVLTFPEFLKFMREHYSGLPDTQQTKKVTEVVTKKTTKPAMQSSPVKKTTATTTTSAKKVVVKKTRK